MTAPLAQVCSQLLRRITLFGAVALGGQALAAGYPVRPVTLVVPFSAGAASDAAARTIAPKLGQLLGQSVVVENRDGAAGLIGAQQVQRAAPDGYVLLFTGSPWAYTPFFYSKQPYAPLKDFKPVAKIGVLPSVLVASPAAPFNDIAGMIAYAKQNPGKLTYSSSGHGSTSHMLSEYLNKVAGINVLHVPYKSTAQALTDVITNQVTMNFPSLGAALPQIRAHKVKALGVSSAVRAKVAPDIPTLASPSAPEFDAAQWLGIVAPAGTPDDVIEKFSAELRKVLVDPEVAGRLEGMGLLVTPGTPADFTADINKDIDKWVPLGKQLGISFN